MTYVTIENGDTETTINYPLIPTLILAYVLLAVRYRLCRDPENIHLGSVALYTILCAVVDSLASLVSYCRTTFGLPQDST